MPVTAAPHEHFGQRGNGRNSSGQANLWPPQGNDIGHLTPLAQVWVWGVILAGITPDLSRHHRSAMLLIMQVFAPESISARAETVSCAMLLISEVAAPEIISAAGVAMVVSRRSAVAVLVVMVTLQVFFGS